MKNVILWGDSIRQGYCQTVADELGAVAQVSWPEINCGNSAVMLAQWQDWLREAKSAPDVLHLNCGLHDMKTVSARSRELVVPLEFYRRNLELLLGELRFTLPDARLIFATTTPVIECQTNEPKRISHRFNSDIEAANEAAREITARHDVEINDVWKLVVERGPTTMITPDGVHYDAANSRVLGEAVARVIAEKWE